MSNKSVYQFALAGISDETTVLGSLILWVSAENLDDALNSLGKFRCLVVNESNLIEEQAITDVAIDDPSVDFDSSESTEIVSDVIESMYIGAIGESMSVIDPGPSSSYSQAFTGAFKGLRVIANDVYLTIEDCQGDIFDCDPDEIAIETDYRVPLRKQSLTFSVNVKYGQDGKPIDLTRCRSQLKDLMFEAIENERQNGALTLPFDNLSADYFEIELLSVTGPTS